jgi:hypothetical protein
MIESHQDLLEKYFSAERGVISEYSVNIEGDTEQLYQEVKRYAEANGLQPPERPRNGWYI